VADVFVKKSSFYSGVEFSKKGLKV